MVPMTIRFRAESRIAYAHALVLLAKISRDEARKLQFTFGPLRMEALEAQGLVISGPSVGEWADDFLRQVPGLHRVDE